MSHLIRLIPIAVAASWLLGMATGDPPQDRASQDRAPRDRVAAKPEGQAQGQRTAPFARSGKFENDASVCADCHGKEAERIAGGVHARVPVSPLLKRCETCHGPGVQHIDDNEAASITMPPKLDAAAQRALCAQCHEDQLREHGGPLVELLAAGKRCTTCHKVHELHANVPGAGDDRRFAARSSVPDEIERAGMKVCSGCHGDKPATLERGTHRALLHARALEGAGKSEAEAEGTPSLGGPWHAEAACEACHGAGARHVETSGIARFITRPDRAADGIETCRQCHPGVDPVKFHWKHHSPMLGGPDAAPLTCTTCHVVHTDGDPTRVIVRSPAPRADPVVDTSRDAALGAHACVRCHAPAYDVHHGAVHASLGSLRCVSCHPGAGRHAESGGRKELVVSMRGTSAAFQARTCMQCHDRDAAVCGFSIGTHAKHGVACLTCHSPNAPAEPHARKQHAHRACASCHGDVALSFRHANRHPVGEGDFTCSSCHDPHLPKAHGPRAARRMAERCVSCHREYRGPFVFEHHADKTRGCLACHVAHGSPNRKLLERRQARDGCLACHADLPAFHDQSPGSRFRNCLDCHTHVHGSNRNRFFLR